MANAKGSTDTATARFDASKSAERVKEDHPEGPDTLLGMQDERGRKGM